MAGPFKRTVEKTTETMPLVPKTPATAIFLDQKIQFMGAACLFFSLETNHYFSSIQEGSLTKLLGQSWLNLN